MKKRFPSSSHRFCFSLSLQASRIKPSVVIPPKRRKMKRRSEFIESFRSLAQRSVFRTKRMIRAGKNLLRGFNRYGRPFLCQRLFAPSDRGPAMGKAPRR